VSSNTEHVFGFAGRSLERRSVNAVMPAVFAKWHDAIMVNFLNVGQESIVNSIRHIWAVDYAGTAFSINLCVKIFPSLFDYQILGMVHKLNDQDYVITDSDGEISAYGRRFAALLGVDADALRSKAMNIQLLAPLLVAHYKDYFLQLDDGQGSSSSNNRATAANNNGNAPA
jgi:hypothetical protein